MSWKVRKKAQAGRKNARRKKIQIGRERPHFFGFQPPKKFVGSLPPSQEIWGRVLRGCIHRPENLSDKKCDNLHENERRSQLSILKSPPKQPKAVTIQARVEESVKTQLELYAEFIDASPSYVITEALKLLFRKDDDFRRWVDEHTNNQNNEKAKRDVLAKAV
jgi:predicted transcriptional regulator